MKVWLVWGQSGEYDTFAIDLLGVFSNEAAAKAQAERSESLLEPKLRYQASRNPVFDEVTVEEWEVDGPPPEQTA